MFDLARGAPGFNPHFLSATPSTPAKISGRGHPPYSVEFGSYLIERNISLRLRPQTRAHALDLVARQQHL